MSDWNELLQDVANAVIRIADALERIADRAYTVVDAERGTVRVSGIVVTREDRP